MHGAVFKPASSWSKSRRTCRYLGGGLQAGPLAPFSGLALAWAVHARITFTVSTTVLGGGRSPSHSRIFTAWEMGPDFPIGPGLALLLPFSEKFHKGESPYPDNICTPLGLTQMSTRGGGTITVAGDEASRARRGPAPV